MTLELMKGNKDFSVSCPIPIERYPQILTAHGGDASVELNLDFWKKSNDSSRVPHILSLTSK